MGELFLKKTPLRSRLQLGSRFLPRKGGQGGILAINNVEHRDNEEGGDLYSFGDIAGWVATEMVDHSVNRHGSSETRKTQGAPSIRRGYRRGSRNEKRATPTTRLRANVDKEETTRAILPTRDSSCSLSPSIQAVTSPFTTGNVEYSRFPLPTVFADELETKSLYERRDYGSRREAEGDERN